MSSVPAYFKYCANLMHGSLNNSNAIGRYKPVLARKQIANKHAQ